MRIVDFKPLIKIAIVGSITGGCTGVLFIFTTSLLSIDNVFSLLDLSVALITPAAAGKLVSTFAKSRVCPLVIIAYLTFIIQLLGPAFGGTGSEPLWGFGFLGVAGGLVWSIPRLIWNATLQFRNKS